jgi:hypothetical protein
MSITQTRDPNALRASQCLMEHQILHHVKDALRITLSWDTSSVGLSRKISSVQFTLHSLRRHLERVMALEEEDGYMAIVGDLKPNLDNRASKLRNEHRELRETIGRVVAQFERIGQDEGRFDHAGHEVSALLDRIDRHDKQETELLQAAFYDDVGGEG